MGVAFLFPGDLTHLAQELLGLGVKVIGLLQSPILEDKWTDGTH